VSVVFRVYLGNGCLATQRPWLRAKRRTVDLSPTPWRHPAGAPVAAGAPVVSALLINNKNAPMTKDTAPLICQRCIQARRRKDQSILLTLNTYDNFIHTIEANQETRKMQIKSYNNIEIYIHLLTSFCFSFINAGTRCIVKNIDS